MKENYNFKKILKLRYRTRSGITATARHFLTSMSYIYIYIHI